MGDRKPEPERRWYVRRGDHVDGPHPESRVKAWLADGHLPDDVLLSNDCRTWRPVKPPAKRAASPAPATRPQGPEHVATSPRPAATTERARQSPAVRPPAELRRRRQSLRRWATLAFVILLAFVAWRALQKDELVDLIRDRGGPAKARLDRLEQMVRRVEVEARVEPDAEGSADTSQDLVARALAYQLGTFAGDDPTDPDLTLSTSTRHALAVAEAAIRERDVSRWDGRTDRKAAARELEHFLDVAAGLRWVLLVRVHTHIAPHRTTEADLPPPPPPGDLRDPGAREREFRDGVGRGLDLATTFVPGHLEGDAFFCDLETEEILGSFGFVATSSNAVNADRFGTGSYELFKDLTENAKQVLQAELAARWPLVDLDTD